MYVKRAAADEGREGREAGGLKGRCVVSGRVPSFLHLPPLLQCTLAKRTLRL